MDRRGKKIQGIGRILSPSPSSTFLFFQLQRTNGRTKDNDLAHLSWCFCRFATRQHRQLSFSSSLFQQPLSGSDGDRRDTSSSMAWWGGVAFACIMDGAFGGHHGRVDETTGGWRETTIMASWDETEWNDTPGDGRMASFSSVRFSSVRFRSDLFCLALGSETVVGKVWRLRSIFY